MEATPDLVIRVVYRNGELEPFEEVAVAPALEALPHGAIVQLFTGDTVASLLARIQTLETCLDQIRDAAKQLEKKVKHDQ